MNESTAEPDPAPAGEPAPGPTVQIHGPGTLVGDRYHIGAPIGRRGDVSRFHARDVGSGQSMPLPIVLVCQPAEGIGTSPETDSSEVATGDMPPGEADSVLADTKIDIPPFWPSIRWEKRILSRTSHLSLPRVLDHFFENGYEYLIEEMPFGSPLWDAWDERPVLWSRRFGWLAQLAEAMLHLHSAGALFECLTPEMAIVTAASQATFCDLSRLLPMPVPKEVEISPDFSVAPELRQRPLEVDGHANLYSFGALLQALLFGRELAEPDFKSPGVPRPLFERDAECHPILGRLLARTFVREPRRRFPSYDQIDIDPTGFRELLDNLEIAGRSLDRVRLDVASWSNTGLVRAGNEDAVAVLHSSESRQDDTDDFTLIALADGMGGMASGELAAAIAIQSVRDFFLRHSPMTDLLLNRPPTEVPVDFPALIDESLREANRLVNEEAQKLDSHRGMGCTAEVVLIDGRHVYIGHVGDSRVYHLSGGRMTQITHDHTLVSQLVALGQLTEEEAEHHPQRSELQQAIGGRRDVYPDHYSLEVQVGDWLLVCTDGLSNQMPKAAMAAALQAAGSAEKAARRLVNQVIIDGALDNVTVAVVRVC